LRCCRSTPILLATLFPEVLRTTCHAMQAWRGTAGCSVWRIALSGPGFSAGVRSGVVTLTPAGQHCPFLLERSRAACRLRLIGLQTFQLCYGGAGNKSGCAMQIGNAVAVAWVGCSPGDPPAVLWQRVRRRCRLLPSVATQSRRQTPSGGIRSGCARKGLTPARAGRARPSAPAAKKAVAA